jgi:hypothetical protein
VDDNPQLLALARRHVAEAEARIDRQRSLIADMRERGQATEVAEDLLDTLLETTRHMRQHRDYIEDQQSGS